MKNTWAAREAKGRITAEMVRARTEDIRWMAATGEDLAGAARRLGISAKGVEKFAERHGLDAELDRLRCNAEAAGRVRQGRIGMVLA